MTDMRRWVPVLFIIMMLALPVSIDSSGASADVSEFTTYEGHTYGYTTHFNDPNYDYPGDTRTVDVHIKRIREKISDHEKWKIETVWGVGYKFEIRE